MSADTMQVMRVLERCVGAAEGSGAAPGVAAAAARVKADPRMHAVIWLLLSEQRDEIALSWGSWRRALADAREAGSCELLNNLARCPGAGHMREMISGCQEAAGQAGPRTTATLAEMLVSIIMLESTSLGSDRSRDLRNSTSSRDAAAAVTAWRNSAVHHAGGAGAFLPRTARADRQDPAAAKTDDAGSPDGGR
jgi:hypothetical protein